MLQHKWVYVAVATVACILQAQGADKYTDENRPYEFGFNIDGEQHRHEKKDEKGLIMGEFGFITADGVYHVTVYATDENGKFIILSMKNIRVKPYPTAPVKTSAEKKGHSIPFPPSQNPPQTQGPTPQSPSVAIQGPSAAAPAKACSGCSIPTTTTKRPQLTDIAVVSQDRGNNQFGGPGNTQYPQGQSNYPGGHQNNNRPNESGQKYPQGGPGQNNPNEAGQQNSQGGSGQNYPNKPGQHNPQSGSGQNYPNESGQQNPQSGPGQNYPNEAGQQNPQSGPGQNYPNEAGQQNPQGGRGQNYPQGPGGTYPQPGVGGQPANPQGNQGGQQDYPQVGDRNPKQFNDYPSGPQGPDGSDRPSKPTLITAQMQIVDKNTDIHHKNPGEKDGLPDGLTKGDMVRLLYTFNYTVGFHGHFEEGYTDGSKQGYYFVTGRNGVKTRVDYVADEKGFRPKISQEVLDILSDDVPKPETEKDEKYGLKGYEFKWLYYPVGSSRR